MKKKILPMAALLAILSALLPACSSRGFPLGLFATATSTPTPTSTPTATASIPSTTTVTRTPTQTFTPSNTFTPTLTFTPVKFALSQSWENPHGYSFRYPAGWSTDPRLDLDGALTLFGPGSLVVDTAISQCRSDPCLDDSSDGEVLTVGGQQGLRRDCSPGDGLCWMASIPLGDGRLFSLQVESHGEAGPNEVRSAFDSIAGSVRFFPPHVTPCNFAPDETYGLTPENPIRIGGGGEDTSRIRGFMYALGGAGGMEPLYYKWAGTISQGGRLLDVYVVHYEYESPGAAGPEATFYFDRRSYERPLAPFGFPCTAGYFPFAEP